MSEIIDKRKVVTPQKTAHMKMMREKAQQKLREKKEAEMLEQEEREKVKVLDDLRYENNDVSEKEEEPEPEVKATPRPVKEKPIKEKPEKVRA